MTIWRGWLSGLAILALAAARAAAAQELPPAPSPPPADDPIAALLEASPPAEPAAQPAPPSEAAPPAVQPTPAPPPSETAPPAPSAPPLPPPALPPTPAPLAPVPYTPFPAVSSPYARPPAPAPRRPRPQLSAPVNIDELGKTPEAPPTPTDLNYETRMRASFNAAQGLQGPLDGRWTLSAAGGEALYALQLVDTGGGLALEGAWRDPHRKGAVDASGFLDNIQRSGADLYLRFTARPGAEPTVVTLSPGADGRWTGELHERGERRKVTLKRDAP